MKLAYLRYLKQLAVEAKTQATFKPNTKVCRSSRQTVINIGKQLKKMGV
jgi:hypothetical protein